MIIVSHKPHLPDSMRSSTSKSRKHQASLVLSPALWGIVADAVDHNCRVEVLHDLKWGKERVQVLHDLKWEKKGFRFSRSDTGNESERSCGLSVDINEDAVE